jgi:hypothetical protein
LLGRRAQQKVTVVIDGVPTHATTAHGRRRGGRRFN